jgi:hypothetical protein
VTITLAFYKGTLAENSHALPFDRLVCWWRPSRGRFSHVELVVTRAGPYGWCCSSSARDGGVRCKSVDLSTGRWVLVDLPALELDGAQQWFQQRLGKPYDYPGILGYVVPLVKQWRDWWYCSEAVTASLGVFDDSHVPPNRLFELVVAMSGARIYEVDQEQEKA